MMKRTLERISFNILMLKVKMKLKILHREMMSYCPTSLLLSCLPWHGRRRSSGVMCY
jgi:hypothetical protein